MNTHLEQWAAIYAAAPGELGVRCLAQGSHLSRGIEGGESAGHSLSTPTIPAGPETRTHDFQVTGPTLYPLGHNCPTGAGVWCIPSFSEHCTSVDFPWNGGSKNFKEKFNGNSQTDTIKWAH